MTVVVKHAPAVGQGFTSSVQLPVRVAQCMAIVLYHTAAIGQGLVTIVQLLAIVT